MPGGLTPPEQKKETGPPAHGSHGLGKHATNEHNNRCDEMAVLESRKYKG